MNNTAEVYLWGTRIGIIHQDVTKAYASFEYDKDFIKSGIEVSPLRMPLAENIYEFPGMTGAPFYGMPGLVADSLPDGFGNAVIEQWLVSLGRSMSDFTAIDRLCYTGKRGMGALEYVPASTDIKDIDDNLTYAQLVQVGSSAGGARAKAVIAWNEETNEIRSGQKQLERGYELAAMYMKELGISHKEIEQFYRRMVFNCLAVNQDDHVKNISFIMDKSGKWTLSPAYDITFSYDPDNKCLRAHQMTINGMDQVKG